MRLTCTICGEKAKLPCPCGTTQYCSTDCQRIDWRDRGHRKACKKIRAERAAEAARAEAPTPPPEVVYGPAPRSHADEVRARIAAEHEAARKRREANPEPEPVGAREGSRCPICLEDWDVNLTPCFRTCCCRMVCRSCMDKTKGVPCPLCRAPYPTPAESLARIRRHAENDVDEAARVLGELYDNGRLGVVKSTKKAAKIYKRAVELGSTTAMVRLAFLYHGGDGVKLNRNKAKELYRMAADRGNATAQANLAKILRTDGKPVEAFQYSMRAAEQGYTDAEAHVGMAYGVGEGVEENLTEAHRWLSRAAAKGDVTAANALDLMRRGAVYERP